MLTLTLCILSVLSLFFSETRLFGWVGLVVIITLFPVLLIVPVGLSGIYFYLKHQR